MKPFPSGDSRIDRLYDLLPAFYRAKDAELGQPLRDLLRVIAEQVTVVEDEIAQMYENWFIETADDWAVPYIGELVGYEPARGSGPGDSIDVRRVLTPRRDVTNTIRARRRKGTLALLEELARDTAGWPARAVEFATLLGCFQSMNSSRPRRGGTLDIHSPERLERLETAFNRAAHSVDVRRISSAESRGLFNVPSVGLFVWRLQAFTVTEAPAACLEELNPLFYAFSLLGNDTPLYNRAIEEEDPTGIAGERNLPTPIRRRAMEKHLAEYYGEGRSVFVWVGRRTGRTIVRTPLPAERLVIADLSDWDAYSPRDGTAALDPVLGRLSFSRTLEPVGVWVSYLYGFSAAIGGGEYPRALREISGSTTPIFRIQVRRRGPVATIEEALRQWGQVRDKQPNAIIELTDSEVYGEPLDIPLRKGESLQIRAANRARPVIYLLDRDRNRADALTVYGDHKMPGGCLTLDGLLIAGRAVHLETLDGVTIRHCTLVPGWMLTERCEPKRPSQPSLELYRTRGRVCIERSILGSIEIFEDEVGRDPLPLSIADSVIDATRHEFEAIGAPNGPVAHATVTIRDSTVIGKVSAHAIALAENTIFTGHVQVARRQIGCIRFSYVPAGSRTPRRFNCQPDRIVAATRERATREGWNPARLAGAIDSERLRVHPQFNSVRYPEPSYAQLADTCALEITEGAEDGGEMGALHHLHQTERLATLRARLADHTPAGADAAVILAS